MSLFTSIITGISEVLWPRVCHGCGQVLSTHSRYLCPECLSSLRYIPYVPASQSLEPANRVDTSLTANRLAGCRNLVHAASWLAYSAGSVEASLLADVKYRGCRRLARYLGECMAEDFMPTDLFEGIDLIVPVPLHPLRRMKRGYNQSEEIARGIADVIGRPVENLLHARYHRTQTRLDYKTREKNVAKVYKVADRHPGFQHGGVACRHILLVDDVCTTGSTLLHSANALTGRYPHIAITVLTLALATRK